MSPEEARGHTPATFDPEAEQEVDFGRYGREGIPIFFYFVGTMAPERVADLTYQTAKPAAATSACRRVMSATKPPPSTPKAVAAKNAVNARFATENGTA